MAHVIAGSVQAVREFWALFVVIRFIVSTKKSSYNDLWEIFINISAINQELELSKRT